MVKYIKNASEVKRFWLITAMFGASTLIFLVLTPLGFFFVQATLFSFTGIVAYATGALMLQFVEDYI